MCTGWSALGDQKGIFQPTKVKNKTICEKSKKTKKKKQKQNKKKTVKAWQTELGNYFNLKIVRSAVKLLCEIHVFCGSDSL